MTNFIYVRWLVVCLLLSFTTVKAAPSLRALSQDIYSLHPYTLFCQYPLADDFTLMVRACDLCPPEARKVKWMNIVPAKRLASGRLCHEHKICLDRHGKPYRGLRCCRKKDEKFIAMEHDLHNIVPEDPRLARLNIGYTLIDNQPSNMAFVCDVRIDHKTKTLQPPPQSRGQIARAYLYMSDHYQLELSEQERALFLKWHTQHPPTAWEQEKNIEIFAHQNTRNHWVE